MLCGMHTQTTLVSAHPVDKPALADSKPNPSWPVDAPGGRFYAESDPYIPLSRDG